jgi:hypothetical protein
MKYIRAFYGLLSLFSLIAGITIYLLFRDLNNMLLFAWVPKPIFAGTALIPLRPSFFSNILRYNLPDTLWFLSAVLFFRYLWFYRIKTQKVYIHYFYAVAAIFEISQLSEKVPGTFDLLDLFFMGICAFIEGLLYNTSIKRGLS